MGGTGNRGETGKRWKLYAEHGVTRRRERAHALVKKLEDGFGREFGERLEGRDLGG